MTLKTTLKLLLKMALGVIWTLVILTALSASWRSVSAPSTAENWLGVAGGLATLVVMPIGYAALVMRRKK